MRLGIEKIPKPPLLPSNMLTLLLVFSFFFFNLFFFGFVESSGVSMGFVFFCFFRIWFGFFFFFFKSTLGFFF